MKRPPSLRIRVPDEVVAYDDGVAGHVEQNLAREVGDFVLKRGDGIYAYQLAVVVDDLAMDITDVVRGADLLASTPRQIFLARVLDRTAPRFWHVPLVVAPDGARLEKRERSANVRVLHEGGVAPEQIVGELAFGLGIAPTRAPTTAAHLADPSAPPITWRRDPWPVPPLLG
jgi:glutamyl-tRNA synthetase